MSYEMFLTMQLVHLNCMNDHVQFPMRKEGRYLFRITSDDSSRFTPINIHEDEPESPRVRDTVREERASEEYKREVDPPREMKNILGTRDNSI